MGSLIDTGGSGRPVVFLHGFPDTPHMWRDVIERLRPHYRCIAPTLPGFGDHQPDMAPDYTPAGRTRFVQSVMDLCGVTGPVSLVAHDHGGPFAMQWAIDNAGRLDRVALLGTLWPPGYRWHFWARQWRTPLLGELVMATYGTAPGKWIGEREMRRGSKGLDLGFVRETLSRLHPAFLRNALALYRATDARSFDGAWQERWKQVARQVPVLVLWGGRDPYLPARHAHDLGGRRVEVLEDCGHWIAVEAPDQVAAALRPFLD
jgi:haloalkane dehalogenase